MGKEDGSCSDFGFATRQVRGAPLHHLFWSLCLSSFTGKVKRLTRQSLRALLPLSLVSEVRKGPHCLVPSISTVPGSVPGMGDQITLSLSQR